MIETIVEQQDDIPKNEYPKLMKHKITGSIILMKSETCGTILVESKEGQMKVGDHSSAWLIEILEDFHGKVTLISK